jgi:hypothetical protein
VPEARKIRPAKVQLGPLPKKKRLEVCPKCDAQKHEKCFRILAGGYPIALAKDHAERWQRA